MKINKTLKKSEKQPKSLQSI